MKSAMREIIVAQTENANGIIPGFQANGVNPCREVTQLQFNPNGPQYVVNGGGGN
jgi:hypothetical protein